MTPSKKEGILLCTCRFVGQSIVMSVYLYVVQLITQDRFAPQAPNLVGRCVLHTSSNEEQDKSSDIEQQPLFGDRK